MSSNRRHLNPRASAALDRLKFEVAAELGLRDEIERRGWENMTTREVGKIGGNMVKRMVRFAQDAMANGGESVTDSVRGLDE